MRTMPAVLLLAGAAAAQSPPSALTLDQVLARASAYAERFESTFSSIVAEERYSQTLVFRRPTPGRPGGFETQRRELRSDFLLVRSDRSDAAVPFRDVFEVDGRPVREREDRLTKLFVRASGNALEQAQRVTDESTRHNLGPVIRTVNQPTLSLQFLTEEHLRRSTFEKAGESREAGIAVWEVRFREVRTPTLIHTTNNRDLPAEGTFWIEANTGAVVRSQIRTRTGDLQSEITVSFGSHRDLSIRVPTELKERYVSREYELEGKATYSRLRRFQVTTEEIVDDPAELPVQP